MLDRQKVLVVVPAFNEELSVGKVVRDIVSLGLDVLVIDDGSEDRTSDAARSSGAIVAKFPINVGVGGALRCGFRYAQMNNYEIVVQCDADGQHPVWQIPALLEKMQSDDLDMVIGSRFKSSTNTLVPNRFRRLMMKVLSYFASRATGVSLSDVTSGFRAIRQPLVNQFAESFPEYYLGDTYEVVVAAGHAGYHVDEIGVPMVPRGHGSSTASVSHAVSRLLKAFAISHSGLQRKYVSKRSNL